MNPNDFFQQLRDELDGHPLRDRFLEELEAHAQDMEVEKLDDQVMKKRMSDPKSIKKNFMKITNPFGQLFFALEGVFYGALLLPFTMVSHIVLRFIVFPESGFPPTYTILSLLFALFILFIFYSASVKRYEELKTVASLNLPIWLLLNLIPSSIALTILVINQPAHLLNYGSITWMILIYGSLNALSFYLSWLKAKRTKKSAPKKTSSFLWRGIKLALFLYLMLSIIARTLFINLAEQGYIADSVIGPFAMLIKIFGLIMPIEFMSFAWWGMAISPDYGQQVNVFMMFYLPIIILIFVVLQSLWVAIQNKKWFNFRNLVVLYGLSLLFIRGESFVHDYKFIVPAINVSKVIEQEKMGIFYPLLKYFNADEGSLFRYQVGLDEVNKAPIIKSNDGKIYYPEPDFSSLDSNKEAGFDEIISGVFKVGLKEDLSSVDLPDFPCTKTMEEECGLYTYVKRYIAQDIGLPVSDAVFSEDGTWGLIVLPNGAYGTEEVYLVKLKG